MCNTYYDCGYDLCQSYHFYAVAEEYGKQGQL